MFNLQGSEIIFILLLALVVLGPEKLPGAIRKAVQTYNELRKIGNGFQSEFRAAIDEPLREMKATADLIREQADPQKIADQAARASEAVDHAEAVLAADDELAADAEPADQADAVEPDVAPAGDEPQVPGSETISGDAFADPVDDRLPDPVGEPLPDPAGRPLPDPAARPLPDPAGRPLPEPVGEPVPHPVNGSASVMERSS